MSLATYITGGIGPGSTVPLYINLGFSIGEAVVEDAGGGGSKSRRRRAREIRPEERYLDAERRRIYRQAGTELLPEPVEATETEAAALEQALADEFARLGEVGADVIRTQAAIEETARQADAYIARVAAEEEAAAAALLLLAATRLLEAA